MRSANPVSVTWQEDGTATVLARVCARDATGAWTGEKGEGRFVKQADLSSITCNVFDRSSETPSTAIATPTVTISSAIQDSPVTNQEIWTLDTVGYNFVYDLAASNFPTGGNEYLVEFKFTTTGGTVWHLVFQGPAAKIVGS